jgi:hypothetical protein
MRVQDDFNITISRPHYLDVQQDQRKVCFVYMQNNGSVSYSKYHPRNGQFCNAGT